MPHSEKTIVRRRKGYGLSASRVTTRALSDHVKKKLVIDQLERDPLGRLGPRLVKEAIAMDTGIHLTRYSCLSSYEVVLTSQTEITSWIRCER
jgi:hypothetical protein